MCFHKAVSKKFTIYLDTFEMTENHVIPMPGLVWHCKFSP